MKHLSTSMLVTCAMLFGAGSAQAADIIVEEPVAIAPAPLLNSSGWYIRGDIGYTFKSNTDGNWNFWNIAPEPYRGIDDTLRYDDFKLKGGANYGVGAGYRFNDMFRADATLDFFRAGINGRTNCTSYVKSSLGLNPVEDNCHYEDNSTANIWTAMANAYVDLPKMGGLTPYLGAGLGAAYVNYDTWKTTEVCTTCTDPYRSDKEGLDSWRFAMGLMAGVSYDLTEQLKLDVGYRYLRINGGKAYGYDAMDRREVHTNAGDYNGTGPGATGTQAKDNGFDLHTVRAGLRYEFR
ncbi:porin family protein [Falsochrobactrum shanghaiense]|uniref:Porin family protein n=1 Tax=Falsochrobactrum shanghaiense TaxID=2201899 RepID=A0A316JPK9_9HYPH|nr:outer membrane protein [Falsochrobactrum shanghaiense]PWL17160.1 porin family protein [Falsochrobactrum shanghaiense]